MIIRYQCLYTNINISPIFARHRYFFVVVALLPTIAVYFAVVNDGYYVRAHYVFGCVTVCVKK